MTIAADVPFFVTRDGAVLGAADAIHEALGVRVVAPHEMVRHFDLLRREEEYRPRRLCFGAGVTSALARASDLERLVEAMHSGQPVSEPRRHTLARVREMLADPERFEATCIETPDELLAAYLVDKACADRLHVPFFTVSRSPLGRTAARHYGDAIAVRAAREGRRVVHITDGCGRVADALVELGFSREPEGWIKLALPGAMSAGDASQKVRKIGEACPAATALAMRIGAELELIANSPVSPALRAAHIERVLWPAKLTDTGLPCFLVPIQARWAKELFDVDLALGTLFGANPSLVLNSENVYYRAARPAVVTAPRSVPEIDPPSLTAILTSAPPRVWPGKRSTTGREPTRTARCCPRPRNAAPTQPLRHTPASRAGQPGRTSSRSE
jgi:hypothetical protein